MCRAGYSPRFLWTWGDGIIDPIGTRQMLALGLFAAQNVPVPESRFGAFVCRVYDVYVCAI
jgi:hypothetical protein